jgi:hypothetical protein
MDYAPPLQYRISTHLTHPRVIVLPDGPQPLGACSRHARHPGLAMSCGGHAQQQYQCVQQARLCSECPTRGSLRHAHQAYVFVDQAARWACMHAHDA